MSVLTDIACPTCRPFDGREYESVKAAAPQFVDGGRNVACEKGDGCTCTLVEVGEETPPSV